jgi:hypothetical protein
MACRSQLSDEFQTDVAIAAADQYAHDCSQEIQRGKQYPYPKRSGKIPYGRVN